MFYTNPKIGEKTITIGADQSQFFAMQSMIGLLKMLNHLTF